MTLIAAFRVNDIPVLMGDFQLARWDSTEGALVPAGFRRKILRVSSNCTAAWTGPLLWADHVCERLSQRAVSHSGELLDELTAACAADPPPSELTLVGWIDEPPHGHTAWRWSSTAPETLARGAPQVAGSGAAFMKAPTNVQSAMRPENYVMAQMGRLMQAELAGTGWAEHGFGYAFEALMASGEAFRPIQPVVFVGLLVRVESSGRLMLPELRPVLYRYEARGEFALTRRNDRIRKEIDVRLLTPPGYRDHSSTRSIIEAERGAPHFRMEARYYCVVVDFEFEGELAAPFVLTIPSDATQPVSVRVVGGRLELIGLAGLLPSMWEQVRKDWLG